VNSDGSGSPRRLTTGSAEDAWPAFSPSGDKIVYQSNPTGNRDLYIMNADGTGGRQPTDDPTKDEIPSWQPVQW
jgi:TolB protein